MRRSLLLALAYLILGAVWLFISSLVLAEECAWHDHYKVNYRIRHKHCYNTLAEHYKEEPLRQQHFHAAEELDPQEPKEEKPVEKIQSQKFEIEIEVVPWMEKRDEYEKREAERPII
jgi:hypothetical protein